MSRSRRSLLQLSTLLLVTGTTGCSVLTGSKEGVPDVIVMNDRNEDVEYHVSVEDTGRGNVVLDATDTVAADESKDYQNPVKREGNYRLEASVTGGSSVEYEWEVIGESQPDSDGLMVNIRPNSLSVNTLQA